MEEGKILFWIPGSQFVDWSTKARCAATCNCNCCSICEHHSRSQNAEYEVRDKNFIKCSFVSSLFNVSSNPKHSNGVSSSGSTVQIQGSNNNNIIQKMMVF